LQRGNKILNVDLIPRVHPPEGEGAIGIGLARVSKIKSSWYEAPWIGVKVTVEKTIQIPVIFGNLLGKLLKGEKVQGAQMMGPIGIGNVMGQALAVGVDNFLMFVAMIAVWLALFNILPIPALDGGKLLFLIIEAVRKKPVSEKIEQKITAGFFLFLILIMVFVTIKDIINLF